jgi:hypothetical protein
MATWKNGTLTWFISKLKQREWTEYVPVIYSNQEKQYELFTPISWNDITVITASRRKDMVTRTRKQYKIKKNTIGDVALLKTSSKSFSKARKSSFSWCRW